MSLPEKELRRRMKLQQQVANDSPTQLVSKSFRSVEARVARRNSLANVPHLLESDSDSPSGLMLARRSLSDRFRLQEGGMEISPMSDLANNFSSSTLSPSPWRLSGKPKKLAFKVESSPEDENFNTSAANSSAMDSSMDSNGFLFILFWQWTLI